MHPFPTRLALIIAAATILVVELGLMLLLQGYGLTVQEEALIASLALILLALPALYVTLLRPLREQVSQRQGAEQALRESEDRNREILDAVFDGILITDERGVIEQTNPAAARIFGYTREELTGRNLEALIPESERARHAERMRSYLHEGRARVIGLDREIRGRRKDGSLIPIEIAITELWRDDRRHFVGVLRDITARRQAEAALREAQQALERRVAERTEELTRINLALQQEIEARARMQAELERLATTDTLTGIRNRRVFDEQLALEITRAKRYGNKLALILMDIDRFKSINDHRGHQAGDRVLVELARVVASRLRASEVFARWGGEEFIVLAPNTDAEDAAHLAEEIRTRVEAHDFPEVGRVTLSLGVTQYAPEDTTDSLWQRADAALYRAKAGGRNRVEVELA